MLEFEPASTEGQPSAPAALEADRYKESMANYDQALHECNTAIKPDVFYHQLDAVGLSYGHLYRCMTKIQMGLGQSCCEVDIPGLGVSGKEQRPHIIHPGMLDAVFHAVFAALKGSEGRISQLLVPKTIDEMVTSANIAYEAGACVRGFSKAARHGFSDVLAEITMLDQESRPVLKILSFCCSEVGTQSLRFHFRFDMLHGDL